jgi:LuxR family maltose regulon positive regulatory protein
MDKSFSGKVSIAPNQVYLDRPRIDALLEKAVRNPLVMVVAGAGYGKSRAVYSFIRKFNVRAAWIQFSEGDNVTERFWENFVDTVSVINKQSAERIAEIGFPETERQFNRYLEIPRKDIIANEKYIFVYDDIHIINNKVVLDFIERSITMPFHNITSIVISRAEPPLKFSRLKAKELVARITEEDLCFNKEEMIEYLRLLGLRPSMQTTATIYDETEGWAFAIHLAALSLRNSRQPDTYIPHALRSNIFSLIETEIIAGLSAQLRMFLITLSLIEHPVPGLLREIAGGDAGDYSLIDEMEQSVSFIQYDPYLNGYRIHHLFLDYLRGMQHELSGEKKREVWNKAAHWCLQNNYRIDAIHYYEKAGDYMKVLDVMYTFPLAFSRPVAQLLLRIMDDAPAELYETAPAACITHPRLLMALGMFEQAERELRESIARLEKKDLSPDTARSIAGCYNALGFLGYYTCFQTLDYSYISFFEKAQYYATLSNHQVVPPMSVMSLGTYVCRVASTEAGEMERYIEAFEKMASCMTASLNGCGYGMDDLAWGELAFFRGDISRAENHILAAIAKAREREQYEVECLALFYRIRICLYRGDNKSLQDVFLQYDAMLNLKWHCNRTVYHDIGCGWFYVQTGRPEKIAAWLQSDFEESDLNSLYHSLEILVKAKYHFSVRRYPAVLAELESRGSQYRTWSLLLARLEATVLEAVCRYRMGDSAAAFRCLETAWELAKNNNLIMPFIELGKDMRSLAGAALKDPAISIPKTELKKIQRLSAAYAQNLYTISEIYYTGVVSNGRKRRNSAILSSRELAVLTGLSQGFTRKEIAHVSLISINTVKSAAKSIFNKLGARNRIDAVRIATERGILK